MRHLFDCLGVYIWLSLVSPKLEAETKIREAVSYSSLLYVGLTVTGIIVWLPELISYKDGFLGWLLVDANCGLEFCFPMWSGQCSFV